MADRSPKISPFSPLETLRHGDLPGDAVAWPSASAQAAIAHYTRADRAVSGRQTRLMDQASMKRALSASNALHKTYVPVNLDAVYSVDEARRRGRQKLGGKSVPTPAFAPRKPSA